MSDIQSQLPVKIGNGSSTASITGTSLDVNITNVPDAIQLSSSILAPVFVSVVNPQTSVSVSNLPSTQAVSGTVAVSNFPSSQAVTVGESSTGAVARSGSAAAVANGSTGTISYTVTTGKTLYLKQVVASSSGAPCKVVVDYGSSPTVIAVGFYSASFPVFELTLAQPVAISAGTAVNVKVTNNAGAAQDVYATIFGKEV